MFNVPYVVENYIDFADVLAAKGSALAANDTIEALTVPAGTLVLKAGIQTIAVDDATTLTLDMGFTGGDVDEFVDGYDQAAAVAGAYSAYLATDPVHIVPITTADTIDVLFATLTGTLTVGKIRVWALMVDVSEKALKAPSIAQLAS
jgi:hypothetical protein